MQRRHYGYRGFGLEAGGLTGTLELFAGEVMPRFGRRRPPAGDTPAAQA